jgi:hypothetical protein
MKTTTFAILGAVSGIFLGYYPYSLLQSNAVEYSVYLKNFRALFIQDSNWMIIGSCMLILAVLLGIVGFFLKEIEVKNDYPYTVTLAFIGLIIGIPVSYLFQVEFIHEFVSLRKYVENFSGIFEWDEVGLRAMIGLLLVGILGAILGFYMDKSINAEKEIN